jgi:hypothetical protein
VPPENSDGANDIEWGHSLMAPFFFLSAFPENRLEKNDVPEYSI